MEMVEDQDLRFFCLWRDKRIDQTFSETMLAFQHGQACQAQLLETGSLQPFVIEINAVVLIDLKLAAFSKKRVGKKDREETCIHSAFTHCLGGIPCQF